MKSWIAHEVQFLPIKDGGVMRFPKSGVPQKRWMVY